MTDFNPNLGSCIHHLFEQHVAENPDRTALVFKEESLTYAELNERANQLARHLRQHGLQREDAVGILFHRSTHMIISIMATLKAGGAFVPLDPELPEQRLNFIADDARVRFVLTDNYLQNRMQGDWSTIAMDDVSEVLSSNDVSNLTGTTDHEGLAYIIYTSGTTGKPKGCAVEHQNVVYYITFCAEVLFPGPGSKFCLHSSFAFDAVVSNIHWALSTGGSLFLYPKEMDMSAIMAHSFSVQEEVDTIKLTPSHITLLRDFDFQQTSIKKILSGGESLTQLHIDLIQKIDPTIEFVNEYGPTEATIGCTHLWITPDLERSDIISIGRPMDGTMIYILSEDKDLLPLGAQGELYISGPCVVRGYINRPELTSERFFDDPFRPGNRMYKTGDLARWLPDGNLEMTGRVDDQIKINGFRVELKEIEINIEKFEGVEQAVCALKETENDKSILGFVLGKGIDLEGLKKYLRQNLPHYMVPVDFLLLDELPLNSNGKVDKKRLLGMMDDRSGSGDREEAGTPTEFSVLEIWQTVLGRDEMGSHEVFFELGGDSLKALRVLSLVRKNFNIEVDIQDLFSNPTIRDFSLVIADRQAAEINSIPAVEEQTHYPVSHNQKRLWILDQLDKSQTAYNMVNAYRFTGALNTEWLKAAFEQLMVRYEILRTSIIEVDKYPRLKVNDVEDVKIPFDVLEASGEEKDIATRHIREATNYLFNLQKGPLLHARLVRISEDHSLLIFAMHHIISDGHSLGIMARDVVAFYNAMQEGPAIEQPELPIQYKDYAIWHNNSLATSHLKEGRAYWQNQLQLPIPKLTLPTDFPRPIVKTYAGQSIQFSFDGDITAQVMELSDEMTVTPYMTLLSSIYVLLHHYSGQSDIIIGSPMAGRDHSELHDQIGFFANTVPVRCIFDTQDTFSSLLELVKNTTLDAFKWQAYPLDLMIEDQKLIRDVSRNPLFDVEVVMNNTDVEVSNDGELEGLQVEPVEVETDISQFDLAFQFTEQAGELRMILEYNTDLFEEETIRIMQERYLNLVRQIVAKPYARIGELACVTTYEQQLQEIQIADDFN